MSDTLTLDIYDVRPQEINEVKMASAKVREPLPSIALNTENPARFGVSEAWANRVKSYLECMGPRSQKVRAELLQELADFPVQTQKEMINFSIEEAIKHKGDFAGDAVIAFLSELAINEVWRNLIATLNTLRCESKKDFELIRILTQSLFQSPLPCEVKFDLAYGFMQSEQTDLRDATVAGLAILAHQGLHQAIKLLKEISEDDPNEEIREEALLALSDLD